MNVKRMETIDINNSSDSINWWSKDPSKENSNIYYHVDNQPFVKVFLIYFLFTVTRNNYKNCIFFII